MNRADPGGGSANAAIAQGDLWVGLTERDHGREGGRPRPAEHLLKESLRERNDLDRFPDAYRQNGVRRRASDPDQLKVWILKVCDCARSGFLYGPRTRSTIQYNPSRSSTLLGLMLRRHRVGEREGLYYDLGSRSFDRSTSLVGVGTVPVLQWALHDLRSRFRDHIFHVGRERPERPGW